jgi:hypothetical protein
MSLLIADQESRGCNGDSGSGKEDSIMEVNLAEGCKAVNDGSCRLISLVLFGLSGLSGLWVERN